MPNYKKHLIGGGVSYLLLLAFLFIFSYIQRVSLLTGVEWFVCALAGSLFPDIDIKSRGQKYFYRIMLVVFLVFIVKRDFLLLSFWSIFSLLPLLVAHRGIFHRVRFVVGIPLIFWVVVVYNLPSLYYPVLYNTLFFVIGACSHLLLDFGLYGVLRKF